VHSLIDAMKYTCICMCKHLTMILHGKLFRQDFKDNLFSLGLFLFVFMAPKGGIKSSTRLSVRPSVPFLS